MIRFYGYPDFLDKSSTNELDAFDASLSGDQTCWLNPESTRIWAAGSHGAVNVIRDAKFHRGQGHPEYWAQFMAGHKPAPPAIPHVYEKFVHQLKGSGIN